MFNFRKRIRAVFNPANYHGWNQRRSYFEGWYFKLINQDKSIAQAIIPGVAMDADGNQQAFIQILDGINKRADYYKFPISDFHADPKSFKLSIADNTFEQGKIKINLPNFSGQIKINNVQPWPSTWYSPGIMGPFSFVPFMECYHSVLSMTHDLSGEIEIDGKVCDFTGGKGYLEKDWGSSFPEAYIWMQCNHFKNPNISIKASTAKIPWLGSFFIGFIAGLCIDGTRYEFTTYNFSKLSYCQIKEDTANLIFRHPKYILEIKVMKEKGTLLASPISGFMEGRIEESMTSKIEFSLINRKTKQVIYTDRSKYCALEVAGKIELLQTN